MVPKNAKLMRQMLETHFQLHVYQGQSEWLHNLYEAHVQPVLKSHYKNVKGNERGYANRYKCRFATYTLPDQHHLRRTLYFEVNNAS